MKVQMPVGGKHTDDELRFIREMGVEYVNVNIGLDQASYEELARLQERFAAFGLMVSDVACMPLQKNEAIDLGLPGREEEIGRFCRFVADAGRANIPFVSVAWQPNGILRSGRGVGKHTRGGSSAWADMAEIASRPPANGRVYGEEEIWENFAHFLQKTLPVCEQSGVRMALHPNDPPAPSLAGVHSLIYNAEGFRRAFALAGNSPALGMKLCVGCWLEGGEAFGDLHADIEEFCAGDKILCVHFRNVSATLPYFEETLAEDGYADMYVIMKQLVGCGYDGVISVDHAFEGYPSMGGRLGAFAYPTGYLKGLLHAARRELAAGQ